MLPNAHHASISGIGFAGIGLDDHERLSWVEHRCYAASMWWGFSRKENSQNRNAGDAALIAPASTQNPCQRDISSMEKRKPRLGGAGLSVWQSSWEAASWIGRWNSE
jgi:hypothetical protein